MAGVFKAIPSEDQTITPFKVYKSWEYTGTGNTDYLSFISQSILVCTAIKPNPANFTTGKIPLDFEEECNIDYSAHILNTSLPNNIPAGVLWHSLKHLYFNDYNGQINSATNAVPYINNPDNLDIWSGTAFKKNFTANQKSYENIENILNVSSSYLLGSIASVISIPQSKFGEEIKPGSVRLVITSSISNMVLTDDGHGNLIDSKISSSVKLNNRIYYLGFNESEYETDLSKTNLSDPRYPTETNFYNVTPVTSFISSDIGELEIPGATELGYYGLAGYFSQSYVRLDGTPSYFNPRTDDNYAISFWFKLDSLTPGHGKNSYLISKRNVIRNYALVTPAGRRIAGNSWNMASNIFPYDVSVTPLGTVQAKVGDGTTVKTLTSSTTISTNNYYHCVFQKSGSAYELWIDGTREDSELNVTLNNIANSADIFIGSLGTERNNLDTPYSYMHGKIDEVQIFNTFLTQSEIQVLSYNDTVNNNLLNRHGVGKILYKNGLIIINNPNPKYGSKFNTMTTYFPVIPFSSVLYNNGLGFIIQGSGAYTINQGANEKLQTNGLFTRLTLQWNSTLTLYENEILCRINEEEFNFTLNPSILKDSENGQLPKEFIYNDEFGPYITTIGLYNENAELLAIGKLGGPIKKRSNVDLNIIVRFDQ